MTHNTHTYPTTAANRCSTDGEQLILCTVVHYAMGDGSKSNSTAKSVG